MNSETQLQTEPRPATDTASTHIDDESVTEISQSLQQLLADVSALYLKTRNFHWQMTGSHFRDYHLLLDEQSEQIFRMTDNIAERARKIGGTALRSSGDMVRHQRLKDNNQPSVTPKDMLAELAADNLQLTIFLRFTHGLREGHNDEATTSLIENWIDD